MSGKPVREEVQQRLRKPDKSGTPTEAIDGHHQAVHARGNGETVAP